MRIGAVSEASSGGTGRTPQGAGVEAAPQGRALVVTQPPGPRRRPAPHRQAPFLAQLLATQAQHPQTRTRRRAEPGEAIAAYRTIAELVRD